MLRRGVAPVVNLVLFTDHRRLKAATTHAAEEVAAAELQPLDRLSRHRVVAGAGGGCWL